MTPLCDSSQDPRGLCTYYYLPIRGKSFLDLFLPHKKMRRGAQSRPLLSTTATGTRPVPATKNVDPNASFWAADQQRPTILGYCPQTETYSTIVEEVTTDGYTKE